MASLPDTCTIGPIGSKTNLASMASDQVRFLRNANPSSTTVFGKPKMSHDADDEVNTFEQALGSSIEGPMLPLAEETAYLAPCSTPGLLLSA